MTSHLSIDRQYQILSKICNQENEIGQSQLAEFFQAQYERYLCLHLLSLDHKNKLDSDERKTLLQQVMFSDNPENYLRKMNDSTLKNKFDSIKMIVASIKDWTPQDYVIEEGPDH